MSSSSPRPRPPPRLCKTTSSCCSAGATTGLGFGSERGVQRDSGWSSSAARTSACPFALVVAATCFGGIMAATISPSLPPATPLDKSPAKSDPASSLLKSMLYRPLSRWIVPGVGNGTDGGCNESKVIQCKQRMAAVPTVGRLLGGYISIYASRYSVDNLLPAEVTSCLESDTAESGFSGCASSVIVPTWGTYVGELSVDCDSLLERRARWSRWLYTSMGTGCGSVARSGSVGPSVNASRSRRSTSSALCNERFLCLTASYVGPVASKSTRCMCSECT
mmetsp:Transcript_28814/g.65277  ORF Transcript_28814/g.65277 Transcript_28814/m.65277 type:complete len:278 (+) Transcript_28814:724-1557(+)